MSEITPGSRNLVFKMRIPLDDDDVKLVQDALLLAIDIADYIGQFGKMSAATNERIDKIRQQAIIHLQKEEEKKRKEELADKKIKEKRLRDAAAMKLDPDSQRKYQAKEDKKEAKEKAKRSAKSGKMILSR